MEAIWEFIFKQEVSQIVTVSQTTSQELLVDLL
jgi:hypothetical protein